MQLAICNSLEIAWKSREHERSALEFIFAFGYSWFSLFFFENFFLFRVPRHVVRQAAHRVEGSCERSRKVESLLHLSKNNDSIPDSILRTSSCWRNASILWWRSRSTTGRSSSIFSNSISSILTGRIHTFYWKFGAPESKVNFSKVLPRMFRSVSRKSSPRIVKLSPWFRNSIVFL